jgi:hypothetical protein
MGLANLRQSESSSPISMKRVLSSLLVTGLILAAAAKSTLVQAQYGAAQAPAVKKMAPPPDAPKDAGTRKDAPVSQGVAPAKKAPGKKLLEAKQAEAMKKQEVTVKQAIKARNRRVVAVNANANLNPMIQQFTQQGRPMMRSEVLLVHSLYHLSKDQLKALVKGAEAGLETVAKEMAEHQQGGVPRVVVRGRSVANPDWAKRLEETIGVEFKKLLTPEQFARYQSEVDKRSAERKEMGLRFMVDAIDRELLLSPKQRDQLMTTLGPKWEGGWAMYLEYIMYGNNFFPQEVDRIVTPVLDETQKKVWQGAQKVSGFWGFGGMWGFQNAEDPLAQLLAEGQEKPLAKERVIPPPPR